ncbi:MAG: hypothetical protein ABIY55_32215 [Kofleriaceae bacterium]
MGVAGVAGLVVVTLGGAAHGDERPPVRLELGACLDGTHDAIQHAVRVEVGDDAASDTRAVAVRVDCAAEGLDAGVVLEVRPPDGARRYRYALDWRAQPVDARPRLIGLAVAEAVDASRIELTAVAEPVEVAASPRPPLVAVAASPWSFAIALGQRAFSAGAGVDLVGVGFQPVRRLTPELRIAADLVVEGATVLTTSGAIAVRSLSTAPRLVYRLGGAVHGELGLGARLGVVSLAGEALPRSQLVGHRLVRAWLGPLATLAIGTDLTPRLAVAASFELGLVATGATARDLGEPVAVLEGAWTSFALSATIAL